MVRHSEGGDSSSPLLRSTFPSEAFLHYRLTTGLQVVLLMPSKSLGDNWTSSKSLERMSKLKKSEGNIFSDTNDHIRH